MKPTAVLSRRRGGLTGLLCAALLALSLGSAWTAHAAQPESAPPGDPAAASASGEAYDVGMLAEWYELQLVLMKETPGFSPPVVGRALAYVGVSAWEALAPSLPDGLSLAGRLAGLGELPAPPTASWHGPAAVNHALAETIRGLYPNAFAVHLAAVDDLERTVAEAYGQRLSAAELERSRVFGREVASAVLAWASTDGGSEGHLGGFFGFAPSPEPGAWVPTPRNNGPAFPPLHPTWGDNRPLALAAAETCPAPPPPAYSEAPDSELYREALEVYDTVRNLTPEQREIALFWSDDPGQTATPAGHWASILGAVLETRPTPFATAVEAYARLGIAVNDAFIACWTTKYRYDLLRPITYIQRVIDPAWNAQSITDPVITPPFPEYTSGHSVVSSAAATALAHVFGTVAFTDRIHADRGLGSRRYGSFQEAAAEAAISRLYGGIHFRAAIEEGMLQGRCVGEQVTAIAFWSAASDREDR